MRPVRSMTVTSQLMGLHPDMLRRYERGEVEPSMDALYKIADYYGVSTDYLMGRTNSPTKVGGKADDYATMGVWERMPLRSHSFLLFPPLGKTGAYGTWDGVESVA